MTKLKTIQEVAEEMAANLVTDTRTNGEQYIHMKNDIDWMRNICFKAHGDRLPNDWIYSII